MLAFIQTRCTRSMLAASLTLSTLIPAMAGAQSPPAQTGIESAEAASPPTAAVSLGELMDMLKAQQGEMAAQRKLIEGQLAELQQQRRQLAEQQSQMQTQTATIAEQAAQLDDQRQAIQLLQSRVDGIEQIRPAELGDEEVRIRARLEKLEQSVARDKDQAETTFDEKSFPGSVPIPGTSSALKVGGFVKMNIVQSFDPIGSQDRFIVGTIPTQDVASTSETSITVSQSRLNLELRDRSDVGTVRAFVEGDFAGEDDQFRLRHAFGQFRDLLAGKTFSTMMDMKAEPEDLDFEGINGRINIRQAQLRYFPKIAPEWNLLLSVEDPDPDVTGGKGVSQLPDLVVSVRRTWFERWHVKTALVLRNITARQTDPVTGEVPPGESTEKTTGWGLTLSGRTAVPFWDTRDSFMFQFNYGKGLGRYINDLGTVGGQDAVFDPNGELEAIEVHAGYLSFQHWWAQQLRSTFIGSWVNVNNLSFQPGDAYNQTWRLSGNLVFSPTARVDVGAELLWGEREDKDGSSGKASQVQVSAKYRF